MLQFKFVYQLVIVALTAMLLVSCGRKEDDERDGGGDVPPSIALESQQASPLKGYQVINNNIRSRMVGENTSFELASYFEPPSDNPFAFLLPQLRELLGFYNGSGMDMRLQGAKANSLNMVLWFLAFNGVAADVGKHCLGGGEGAISLTDNFREALTLMCKGPEAMMVDKEGTHRAWEAIMQFDSTEDEFFVWREQLESPELEKLPRNEFVQQMLLSAMYNPYYLIKR